MSMPPATAATGGAAPWWAVPAGVILGAVLTGLFSFYNERRRAKTALANQDRDKVREACGNFLEACHALSTSLVGTDVDRFRKADIAFLSLELVAPGVLVVTAERYLRQLVRCHELKDKAATAEAKLVHEELGVFKACVRAYFGLDQKQPTGAIRVSSVVEPPGRDRSSLAQVHRTP